MDKMKNKIKSRFKLKPNLFDLAILLVSLIVVSVLLTIVNIRSYEASLESGDRIAHVFYNGEEIKEVNLSTLEEEYVLTLYEKDYPMVKEKMIITFSKEKGVAISESHCPELICVKQGYIYDSSKAIVCLPSSVIITITSNGSGNEGWQG